MAIYHLSAKVIKKSDGRDALSAAAYRSGDKLHSERLDLDFDYTQKGGIITGGVMLPDNAPPEMADREKLWNEVEKVEKGDKAQVAREIEFSLPREIPREEQIRLAKEFINEQFVKDGMAADWNIHDKGDGNPHCHVMLTLRGWDEKGKWEAKTKTVYKLDENGQKIPALDENGNQIININEKTGKKRKMWERETVDTHDWNSKDALKRWRKGWEDICNRRLEELGIDSRIDSRSYEEQGLEMKATIHEGFVARKMERRGEQSDRMETNRQIKADNREIKEARVENARDIERVVSGGREVQGGLDIEAQQREREAQRGKRQAQYSEREAQRGEREATRISEEKRSLLQRLVNVLARVGRILTGERDRKSRELEEARRRAEERERRVDRKAEGVQRPSKTRGLSKSGRGLER